MKILIVLTTLILVLSVLDSGRANELRFAVVPKSINISFFLEVGRGCQDAAKQIGGIKCIFSGPPGDPDVRIQNKILEKIIHETEVDGIAVAVISDYLANHSVKKAQESNIPVITFDSDFDSIILEKDPSLRLAYVGTDNFALGHALGRQLKKLRPDGGKLCIQGVHETSPNVNERMMGVRSALSGYDFSLSNRKLKYIKKLKKINGWTEITRCPLYHSEQAKKAMEQMKFILGRKVPNQVDAFVSLTAHPQVVEVEYRNMIYPFKKRIDEKEIVLVMADTVEVQLHLLKEGLSHINVGQMPYEMGRQVIYTLHKIVTHKKYQEYNYTPLTCCTPENSDNCTKFTNFSDQNEGDCISSNLKDATHFD